jgi:hypothetical protein
VRRASGKQLEAMAFVQALFLAAGALAQLCT